jgi:alpha-D-ribose 1-methylphosphonate 5-triphosphate synthase subunit PhnH
MDPIFDSQRVFRVLVDAMAHPGEVHQLPRIPFERTPAGLHADLLSVLWTLTDNTVGVAVVGPESWKHYIEVNTGCAVAEPGEAAYVVMTGTDESVDLPGLSHGILEFPEDGATLVLLVDRLDPIGAPGETSGNPAPRTMRLTGPGVDDEIVLGAVGVSERLLDSFANANRVYPLGIDLLLLDTDGRIAAIPRSATMEVL